MLTCSVLIDQVMPEKFLEKLNTYTKRRFNFFIMWQTRKMESIFKLKDKNTHPSHVIYKGKCTCEQTYIGETAHNLEVCVNEHSDVNKQSEPAKHIRKHPNHKFSWEVLTTAHSWLKSRTLLSRTKQTSAITGPHLVPHGNWYYITGIT